MVQLNGVCAFVSVLILSFTFLLPYIQSICVLKHQICLLKKTACANDNAYTKFNLTSVSHWSSCLCTLLLMPASRNSLVNNSAHI